MRQRVNRIPSRISTLKELNQKAAIYLPEKVTSLVSEYINLTTFIYMVDGIGLSRGYNEKFFERLLDETVWNSLNNCYNLLLSKRYKLFPGYLRKSVK
jgi:hypothetical protein